jgi:acyl carrier protein
MKTLQDIIGGIMAIDHDVIKKTSSFELDVSADSLDQVEIIMAIEDEYDVEIPDEDAVKFITVNDVIEYLKKRGIAEEKVWKS